ncbi:orotidine 5'-phosphate decarboxylase [Coemansia sp. RSA 638]|nr:orotidine 5'-phosphate decarboxylase [Coemansia sp. RSA 638]
MRGKEHPHPLARELFAVMERKRSNLSLAADVATKAELLALADSVGPYICVLKTHIDVIADFDADLVAQLQALAKKHDFLIFEVRMFADIGKRV